MRPSKESLLAEFEKKHPQATSITSRENGAWSLNYDTHEIKSFLSRAWDTAYEEGVKAGRREVVEVVTGATYEDGVKAERERIRAGLPEEQEVSNYPRKNHENYGANLYRAAVLKLLKAN